MQQPQFDQTKIIRRISTCPAPQGLVVVRTWAWFDRETDQTTVETEIIPAVAVQTAVVWSYSRKARDGGHSDPPTHKELLAAGWHFRGESTDHQVLIVDRDGWLIEADEADIGAGNTIVAMRNGNDDAAFKAKVDALVELAIAQAKRRTAQERNSLTDVQAPALPT